MLIFNFKLTCILLLKVAVLGIAGACRMDELEKMILSDIHHNGDNIFL